MDRKISPKKWYFIAREIFHLETFLLEINIVKFHYLLTMRDMIMVYRNYACKLAEG
jgi:hypothetical protein